MASARGLDPFWPFVHSISAQVAFQARDFEGALGKWDPLRGDPLFEALVRPTLVAAGGRRRSAHRPSMTVSDKVEKLTLAR